MEIFKSLFKSLLSDLKTSEKKGDSKVATAIGFVFFQLILIAALSIGSAICCLGNAIEQ